MKAADINADVGEGLDDEALLPYLTSVSIACGGHAGSPESMLRALAGAHRRGLRAGAHPSYPDREGFGRREITIRSADLEASLVEQLHAILQVAASSGLAITHVKAHGALYNRAWHDPETAGALVRAVRRAGAPPLIFCPAGSAMETAARGAGVGVLREVFLDRRYLAGRLVPRSEANAILGDAADLPQQLSNIASLEFETMCVHGDNPAALTLLRALPSVLAEREWEPMPYPLP